jgi:hypothetical protein
MDQQLAIISTSTAAPSGSAATATVVRAGYGATKCLAYTSFRPPHARNGNDIAPGDLIGKSSYGPHRTHASCPHVGGRILASRHAVATGRPETGSGAREKGAPVPATPGAG